MKKSKHTNGPWLISTVQGEDCLMVGGGDGSEVVADIRTDGPADEVEANAHLIASAPEMYNALRDILRECETSEDGLHEATLGVIAMRTRQMLANAEGRELGMEVKA